MTGVAGGFGDTERQIWTRRGDPATELMPVLTPVAIGRTASLAIGRTASPAIGRTASLAFGPARSVGAEADGPSRWSTAVKRAFDLLGACVLLLAGLPIMAFAALAIRLDGPGPVFFRQTRVGRHGRHFAIIKLRTMVDGADALKPSLIALNEADGLMSLVGPRPLVVDEDAVVVGADRRRLHVPPGMTGPWQTDGPSRAPLAEMVRLDNHYVANWSLWGDVRILARTVPQIVLRRG